MKKTDWYSCYFISALLVFLGTAFAFYRVPVAQSIGAPTHDYGQMGYEALMDFTGTVIVLNPQAGRVLKRVARGMDAQFSTAPFELAQVVTAYAALDAGVITPQTKLTCNAQGEEVDLVEALARPCPQYFAAVSKRITPANFKKAAQVIGFTYYGTEQVNETMKTMRPIHAKIPVNLAGADYEAMAVRGVGIEANDLHYVQLAMSLASNTSTSERIATKITATAQAISALPVPLNRRALSFIRQGLRKAVEEGNAIAAGTVPQPVAGKAGSNDENALFITYAPENNPEIALVIFLREGTSLQAATVAGRFYKAYFGK